MLCSMQLLYALKEEGEDKKSPHSVPDESYQKEMTSQKAFLEIFGDGKQSMGT